MLKHSGQYSKFITNVQDISLTYSTDERLSVEVCIYFPFDIGWPLRVQSYKLFPELHYNFSHNFTELYEYCIKEKIADGNLIAKWKKQGYENLCCLRCIQTRDTNFSTNCICRVPKTKLEEGKIVECVHCGCRGCSG